MKPKVFSFRFLGLLIGLCFSVKRVKRITIPIPDYADDTYIASGISEYDGDSRSTPDGKPKVAYWHKDKKHFIHMPKCKAYQKISVSPLYNKQRTGYATNRRIVIDIYP